VSAITPRGNGSTPTRFRVVVGSALEEPFTGTDEDRTPHEDDLIEQAALNPVPHQGPATGDMDVSVAFRLQFFHVGITDDARVLPLGTQQAVPEDQLPDGVC
jgi:hypothetical protein